MQHPEEGRWGRLRGAGHCHSEAFSSAHMPLWWRGCCGWQGVLTMGLCGWGGRNGGGGRLEAVGEWDHRETKFALPQDMLPPGLPRFLSPGQPVPVPTSELKMECRLTSVMVPKILWVSACTQRTHRGELSTCLCRLWQMCAKPQLGN